MLLKKTCIFFAFALQFILYFRHIYKISFKTIIYLSSDVHPSFICLYFNSRDSKTVEIFTDDRYYGSLYKMKIIIKKRLQNKHKYLTLSRVIINNTFYSIQTISSYVNILTNVILGLVFTRLPYVHILCQSISLVS